MTVPQSGPEPDGWELLRILDIARANVKHDMDELSQRLDRLLSGETIATQFRAMDERLDALEATYVTKDVLAAQMQLLQDRIQANADHINAGQDRISQRVDAIEKQKMSSSQFRRALFIAVLTSVIAAVTTIIITVLHFAH